MENPIIKVENVGKLYKLGFVGTGTLRDDMLGWWAQVRGKANPNLPLGFEDNGDGTHYLWALKNINLSVNPGEILGIIGSNGSGKSTLLKLLSRVTAPTKGIIKIKGRIGSLLEVGTGFHPELTGRENIFLNGSFLGMSTEDINRKFDEIVDFAGVERYIDTPVKRYSSGMYVRLGFAVAAHLDPDILIVDEVLSVGDADFQKKAINKIGNSAQEGRTILFVSHNMGSIRELTTRCIQLKAGEIVDDGTPEQVVENYLQRSHSTESVHSIDQYRYSQVEKITPVKIMEISVKSSERSGGSALLSVGKPVEITVVFKTTQKLESPFIEINVKNSQLTTVTRMHTHGFANITLNKGLNHVTCKIPDVWFYPGNYYLSIGIRPTIAPRQHWDVIQDYPAFRITNIGENSFRDLKQITSVVSLNPNWSVES